MPLRITSVAESNRVEAFGERRGLETQAAIGVFNKYGHTPQVSPRLAGSAPFYQFTERLGLPLVFAGFGHGSGAHAPNEVMLIEPKDGVPVAGLADIEKAYVDFIFALAR